MARRKKQGHDIHGILLLDKRLGISSNKALQDVRFLFQANKAGHTGTLDPLASGLLPICFGEATKVSGMLLDDNKRYQVQVKLGVTTDTGDAEGQILTRHEVPVLDLEKIQDCLTKFTGTINQVPPMYSALKHQGKRLYELAREGLVVDRKARRVTILELICHDFSGDEMTLEVSCTKGTYIRSLAEDIGQELGCGATVTALRRINSGCFNIKNAYTFEQLQALAENVDLNSLLLPVDEPLSDWPLVNLAEQEAEFIRQGGQISLAPGQISGVVRMYYCEFFIGIGELFSDGKLQPKRIFNI